MYTVTRRKLLELLGMGATGAVLTACAPKPQAPTQLPVPQATTASATSQPPPATMAPATGQPPPATTAPATGQAPPEIEVPTGDTLEGFAPRLSNPSQPIKLVYWYGSGNERAIAFIDEIMARFSVAYPNVAVESVAGQSRDMFVAAAAAGTPPDLFHLWDSSFYIGPYVVRNMVLPLDDYVAKDNFPLDDFLPGLVDGVKMDGKMWGMVDSVGIYFLLTAGSLLQEIGKSPSDLPGDADEFWEWTKQLTVKDDAGSIQRLGFNFFHWCMPLPWIQAYGGRVWDDSQGMPTPDHPGVIEALSTFAAQIEYFGLEALQEWTSSIASRSGAQDPFLNGLNAMKIDGDWGIRDVLYYRPEWEVGKDYNIAAPPAPPADKLHGTSAIKLDVWPWVIPTGTQYPDWSWELLRYCCAPEYQINVHAKLKEMVVRKSMLADERIAWWPPSKKAMDLVAAGQNMAADMPMNPIAGEYIGLLYEAYENVTHLREAPEESMKRVKEEAMALMQEQR